jgi:glutamate/tyrosine decarboxylase-like PLP-dependent enzyme
MALRYFGTSGYARLIEHDVAMARRLAELVRATPGFELREPQGLSIVCFRAIPASLRDDDAALDALNQRVLASLQLGGAAFLSSTVLGGRTWLRSCVVNPGTMPEDIDAVFDAVRSYL